MIYNDFLLHFVARTYTALLNKAVHNANRIKHHVALWTESLRSRRTPSTLSFYDCTESLVGLTRHVVGSSNYQSVSRKSHTTSFCKLTRHVVSQATTSSPAIHCVSENRTHVAFSNYSNNSGPIFTHFGTKNGHLIGT